MSWSADLSEYNQNVTVGLCDMAQCHSCFFSFRASAVTFCHKKYVTKKLREGFSPFFAVTCHLSQCHKKIKGYPNNNKTENMLTRTVPLPHHQMIDIQIDIQMNIQIDRHCIISILRQCKNCIYLR